MTTLRMLLLLVFVQSFIISFDQTLLKPAARAGSQASVTRLSQQDAVLIGEAYRLWKSVGEKVWVGWTDVSMPLLYITADTEYAIGFPGQLTGFSDPETDSVLARPVQTRKRTLDINLAASFPIEGIYAVVIGTPKVLEKSPAEWTITAAHEMFHVLQYARGASEKIKSLTLGPPGDASWQLNFPFPYKDLDVMRLIHLQSYPIYLAVNASDSADMKYNAGTAVDAVRVYQSLLQRQSPDRKFYKYSQFQEWTEGIALYTEYKMAEAAVDYHPTEAFQGLSDYKNYQQLWEDVYKGRIFLVKHAGRAAQSRTTFYHLGLGKGLLLDRLMPDWKNSYFAPSVWLDDLLMTALGQPTELKSLTVGMAAPDFKLVDVNGKSVSLNQYRGQVVLLDFWQTWCPPCWEEFPYLKTLQERYRAWGLVVLGVTDRLDADGVVKWREMVRQYGISYSALMDEKGTVAAEYNVSSYPTKFIVDKGGRLIYEKKGRDKSDEIEIEKEILKALQSK